MRNVGFWQYPKRMKKEVENEEGMEISSGNTRNKEGRIKIRRGISAERRKMRK